MTLETTPAASDPIQIDAARIREMLVLQAAEREEILRTLAPRATPNDDPIAYMTTVATRRELEQITAAIGRLDNGTYGRCVACGQGIAPARLDARPFADTCIGCQSNAEHP